MRVPTRQVFINCPFDETYHPFIEAATFPILACGYIPRCALEFGDTGYARLSRITDLIDQCDFSLHDISVPRFNMPFELGLAWSRKRKTSTKKILVIRLDLHSHERSFSDLKALDPVSHSGDPLELVTQVRNWLSSHQAILLNGPEHIKDWHQRFQIALPDICTESGFHRGRLAETYKDLVYCAVLWLKLKVPAA